MIWGKKLTKMPEVHIFHAFFDTIGGGELLALRLSEALNDLGFEIYLHTVSDIKLESISKYFHRIPKNIKLVIHKRPFKERFLRDITQGRSVRLRRLIVYKDIFENEMKKMQENKEGEQKTIVVVETQSNVPSPADYSYIHFPALLEYLPKERRRGISWKIYEFQVKRLIRHFLKYKPKIVLTNSTWTAKKVKKAYGFDAEVIHPPVDIEYFIINANNDKRERMFVTVSRFSPEKNLKSVLVVADKLRDFTFYIMGSTDVYSKPVIEELHYLIDKMKLDNVEILTDVPREKLRKILGEAMFYLHPQFSEHFGISIVEAMASGCIPFVYYDSGSAWDIVSKVDQRLIYRSIEEVVEKSLNLISSGELDKIRKKAVNTSRNFTFHSFKNKLSKYFQ